ncbi:MAG: methyltransferase domain-containing protein [Myxococcaceae bacterium]
MHWTPLEVAARVAKLLSPRAGERVLDVGSGVGKLCIVGALLTEGTWVGVDRNEDCSLAARRIAESVGATRAEFIQADAFSFDWRGFSALYFFNPFGEVDHVGDRAQHEDFAAKTHERLARMPAGTRVVVYFDAGTELPSNYEQEHSEEICGHTLGMWRITR